MLPEQLYHTALTVVDYHVDSSGSTRTLHPLGTHSKLAAAKDFASKALETLGYEPADFEKFETKTTDNVEVWTHGDGVLVYAKAFAGQEFLVGLYTCPNVEQLAGDQETGAVILPRDSDHLHYVIQTKIDYNKDRTGAAQQAEIEGAYARRADAFDAARLCLKERRDEFAQYEERKEGEEGREKDWPFGEDVIVHAIAHTGENYTVAVRTVPGAHKKHSKATRSH